MYTILPFLIIGVLFMYTVRAQDAVMDHSGKPDHVIKALGQKWSWTFDYYEADNPAVGAIIHNSGTVEDYPDLYLPVNQKILFQIESTDVIHSFWIPEFYFKMDAIPGRTNTFEVTPTKLGTYLGKCAELCGSYHSAMLFNVHVVTWPSTTRTSTGSRPRAGRRDRREPQTTAVRCRARRAASGRYRREGGGRSTRAVQRDLGAPVLDDQLHRPQVIANITS